MNKTLVHWKVWESDAKCQIIMWKHSFFFNYTQLMSPLNSAMSCLVNSQVTGKYLVIYCMRNRLPSIRSRQSIALPSFGIPISFLTLLSNRHHLEIVAAQWEAPSKTKMLPLSSVCSKQTRTQINATDGQWASARAVCVLRLVFMADSRTERLSILYSTSIYQA